MFHLRESLQQIRHMPSFRHQLSYAAKDAAYYSDEKTEGPNIEAWV